MLTLSPYCRKHLARQNTAALIKKVRELNQDLGKLTTTSYTDAANYSYRLDRNNVDENTENGGWLLNH